MMAKSGFKILIYTLTAFFIYSMNAGHLCLMHSHTQTVESTEVPLESSTENHSCCQHQEKNKQNHEEHNCGQNCVCHCMGCRILTVPEFYTSPLNFTRVVTEKRIIENNFYSFENYTSIWQPPQAA